MAGTRAGGFKVRDKVLTKDPNYYSKLGRLGGSARVSKGFGKMGHERASAAGRVGGQISRKTPKGMVDVEPEPRGFLRKLIGR